MTNSRDDCPFVTVSADDIGHLIELTLWNHDKLSENSIPESEKAWLSLKDAESLRDQLTQGIEGIYRDIVRAVFAGDCGTCQNIRLVTIERHGRGVREHCPDCRERWDSAFQNIPTFPAMQELEERAFRRH